MFLQDSSTWVGSTHRWTTAYHPCANQADSCATIGFAWHLLSVKDRSTCTVQHSWIGVRHHTWLTWWIFWLQYLRYPFKSSRLRHPTQGHSDETESRTSSQTIAKEDFHPWWPVFMHSCLYLTWCSDGPYKIQERGDKHFTIEIHGKQDVVSLDSLKPAYLEPPPALTEPSHTITPLPSLLSRQSPDRGSHQSQRVWVIISTGQNASFPRLPCSLVGKYSSYNQNPNH